MLTISRIPTSGEKCSSILVDSEMVRILTSTPVNDHSRADAVEDVCEVFPRRDLWYP